MRSSTIALFCMTVGIGGLVGCNDQGPEAPVALPNGDACGDAYFWAATDSGDVAVTVTVEARDRSHREATTLEFVIPDPAVEVEVLSGEQLSRNFCTDLPSSASEPQHRQPATAGEGTITLDPAPKGSAACGAVTGELQVDGLVAQDGTRFAPIRISSDSIGCYAG
jgi:hypothetical protein